MGRIKLKSEKEMKAMRRGNCARNKHELRTDVTHGKLCKWCGLYERLKPSPEAGSPP